MEPDTLCQWCHDAPATEVWADTDDICEDCAQDARDEIEGWNTVVDLAG